MPAANVDEELAHPIPLEQTPGRGSAWMPSRHLIVAFLVPATAIYGILAGIRWPQNYTITHLIMNYHFGFGKRGLIGALIRLVSAPPYHYLPLALLGFVVFAAWFALLAVVSWRVVTRDSGIAIALVLAFLSVGFASFVNDIGRGEHFGLLLALACLAMPTRLPWLAARAVLLLMAVLMQEANFLIIVPLVAFDAWIDSRVYGRWRSAAYASGMILPAVLLTAYLGNLRTACDTPQATAFFQQLAADFEVQWRPVATLCLDGRANAGISSTFMWSVGTSAALFPLSLLVSLPTTVFNLVLMSRVMRGRLLGVTAGLIAVFAPVALLVVAADVVRFVTLIQLTSFLALISVARRLGLPPNGVLPPSPGRTFVVVCLACFELGSSLPLNDGSEMMKFPFEPLIHHAIGVVEGREQLVTHD